MSGWNQQYKDSRFLGDNIIRMLPPEERKRLGYVRAGAGLTSEERRAKADQRAEKKLQENIAALLRQRGITFNQSRMDRETTGKVGWPDFTLAIKGRAIAIEVKKRFGEEPTKEQVACMMGLVKDGWFVRVVRSEAEFLEALKDAEVENGVRV
jgi:hypothetical protein